MRIPTDEEMEKWTYEQQSFYAKARMQYIQEQERQKRADQHQALLEREKEFLLQFQEQSEDET